MQNNETASTQCYSWNNHGNLGDDWIGEVSRQYFKRVISVSERRSLNPLNVGGYRLKRADRRNASGELVLWGGGWIAADRSDSRTFRAWSRHVSRQVNRIVGVGLGIGPFINVTEQQQSDIDTMFSAFDGRLGVRTFADLGHLPDGYSASVGCDVAILDQRFAAPSQDTNGTDSYVVFSFPAFSPHWAEKRNWMTEEWYLDQIGSLAARIARKRRIIFVEFDQVKGHTSDSAYWSHLPAMVLRPRSIEEAASVFRGAHEVYAGRLHAAILGAVVGIPTLAVAYHHKFEVVSELGIPTLGLCDAPSIVPAPERADLTVLSGVRERGLDVLSTVRSS